LLTGFRQVSGATSIPRASWAASTLFNEQAFGVLTSSKLLNALDVSQEDPRVVASYGKGDPKNRDDGGPKLMEHFLRRPPVGGSRRAPVSRSPSAAGIIMATTSPRSGRICRCSIRD